MDVRERAGDAGDAGDNDKEYPLLPLAVCSVGGRCSPDAGISRVRFDVENRLNVNLYVDTANITGVA